MAAIRVTPARRAAAMISRPSSIVGAIGVLDQDVDAARGAGDGDGDGSTQIGRAPGCWRHRPHGTTPIRNATGTFLAQIAVNREIYRESPRTPIGANNQRLPVGTTKARDGMKRTAWRGIKRMLDQI